MNKVNPEEVLEYLISVDENGLPRCNADTKLYIGGDSERFRVKGVWHADYILVLVVHINGNKGCKIFGQVERELDYDQRKDRPVQRLMNEAYKIAAFYETLKDVIEASGFDIQIHVDLNPDKTAGSSCAIDQAVGYIQAMTGIIPFPKPDAFAASYAADRWKEVKAFERRDALGLSKRKFEEMLAHEDAA